MINNKGMDITPEQQQLGDISFGFGFNKTQGPVALVLAFTTLRSFDELRDAAKAVLLTKDLAQIAEFAKQTAAHTSNILKGADQYTNDMCTFAYEMGIKEFKKVELDPDCKQVGGSADAILQLIKDREDGNSDK